MTAAAMLDRMKEERAAWCVMANDLATLIVGAEDADKWRRMHAEAVRRCGELADLIDAHEQTGAELAKVAKDVRAALRLYPHWQPTMAPALVADLDRVLPSAN